MSGFPAGEVGDGRFKGGQVDGQRVDDDVAGGVDLLLHVEDAEGVAAVQ